MDISDLQQGSLIQGRQLDTSVKRERVRQRRLLRVALTLLVPLAYIWYRELSGNPVHLGLPALFSSDPYLMMSVGLIVLLMLMMTIPLLASGKSPHVSMRPSDTDIRLVDVVGAEGTRREAIDTLNLFLAHETFSTKMGGTPRRGVLFEGPPGTGKTYLAKAMAAEAGVPFLFVSASAFQSMMYGQTNRKIRAYFRSLRKAARAEGGAIGFIEEFDAIGATRSGMGSGGVKEGLTGVVNELLVQMQSFDMPTMKDRFRGSLVDAVNVFLPSHRALARPRSTPANILLVAATNRAADLDPALLRPGRFDRVIHFDLPPRADRVAIAAYYLARKSHVDVTADDIADLTAGYSPVKIERLLDEALIVALRHGREAMTLGDVIEAQLVIDVGLSHKVGYDPDERRRVAVHEAGHALVAVLTGREVRLASILRRSGSLGLVAHGDPTERHLKTPTEGGDMIAVALAGRAAEIQEFGEASSGIASDLAAATTLACQLVGQLGAADSLISLEAAVNPIGGNIVSKVLADPPSRAKVDTILAASADRAACMVLEYREALLSIAASLCVHDEIDGQEIGRLVVGAVSAGPAA